MGHLHGVRTVPIALIMGVYGRFIRRGRVAEMSLIGFVLLHGGADLRTDGVADAELAAYFNLAARRWR